MASSEKISALPVALTIDGTADYFPINTASLGPATQRINRSTFLGVSGTPADISTAQAFTNKTIGITNTITTLDSTFTLQDNGDNTKQAMFQLSGITTGTTRTYTLPNISDTLVSLTATQTLTNKTLTSPAISGGTIDNSTVTVDSVAGHTTANSGTIYGVPITLAKIPGTSIANATLTTTQIAASTVASSNINFGGAGAGVWWEEIARTTLGSSGNNIGSNIPTRKYLMIFLSLSSTGGTINANVTFNSDAGTNYAYQQSSNFGGSNNVTSNAGFGVMTTAGAYPAQIIINVLNIAASEKLFQSISSEQNTAGAANAPLRRELSGKWSNTSNAITTVTVSNTGGGAYNTGSELVILGHN